VSSADDFSTSIVHITSKQALTSLRIPNRILSGNTTYYWRARFYDDSFAGSPWSDVDSFTTAPVTSDQNANGIPDAQEVAGFVDLDGNGMSDTTQSDMKVVETAVGGGQMGIGTHAAKSILSVGSVESVDPETISRLARPYDMPLGLFGMELTVTNPIDTGEVTVYFSEPAPAGARWLVYDATEGWRAFDDSKAQFSSDRRSVNLKLKDWGFGDSDGLPNGRIVDPGGFGLASWIQGKVFDSTTGTSVGGAEISIEDLNLPCSADGTYASVILPGRYSVTASAPGYAAKTVGSVEVKESGIATMDFGLSPYAGVQVGLTANGSDAPGQVPLSSALSLELTVRPGNRGGANADWWLAASTPRGLYALVLEPFGWQPWVEPQGPVVQMPLVELSGLALAGIPGLPSDAGTYTFYFGVDTSANGVLDGEIIYDFVTVDRTSP